MSDSEKTSPFLLVVLFLLIGSTVTFSILLYSNINSFNSCDTNKNSLVCPSINCPYAPSCCPFENKTQCTGIYDGLPLCGTNEDMLPIPSDISMNLCFYPYYETDINNLDENLSKIRQQCTQSVNGIPSKGLYAYAWKDFKPYGEIPK